MIPRRNKTMLTLPKSVYCLRYDKSYFGFTGHNNQHVKALVFGFAKEPDVAAVYNLMRSSKRFPSMTLDEKKRIIIHKLPARGLASDLKVKNLLVEEKHTEDFIIQNAVNGVDTCVISNIQAIENFIIFQNYYITKVNETPIEVFINTLKDRMTE